MSGAVGLRVVRGPHWQWQSQDGGEGGLGTVVSVTGSSASTAKAVVRWDTGTQASYRMGEGSAYDLRIFDNGACGIRHTTITCDACHEEGIVGIRWKCRICYDYDLCTSCYTSDKHDVAHEFLRFTEPSTAAVAVPPRGSSSKLEAKGVCPGAIVTRSSDWKWGDQDGGQGKTGVVTEISNWPGNSYRNAVRVYWNATGNSDMYRFGFEGKLDVVATTSQQAGKYYPQHLPNLGEPAKKLSTSAVAVPDNQPFKIGDRVRTNVPVQALIALQADHGGWIPEMSAVVGKIGTVRAFTEKGNVQVEFDSNKKYIFNPAALSKFTQASVGDIVKIVSDIATAKARQEGHGGWNDRMALALGKVGKVVAHTPNGDLKVDVGGSTFIWNPECCLQPTNADKEAYGSAASAPTGRTSPSDLSDALSGLVKILSSASMTEKKFKAGDAVTIMNDAAKAKQLQIGHGGWNDQMTSALGKTGKVIKVDDDGDAIVYVAGRNWAFNPACCTLATESELAASESDDDSESSGVQVVAAALFGAMATSQGHIQIGIMRAAAISTQRRVRFGVGDIVRISGDVAEVKALQRGHGGWTDLMLLALGKIGKVIAIDSDGDVRVLVGGLNWTFNQDCLERVTESELKSAKTDDCLIC